MIEDRGRGSMIKDREGEYEHEEEGPNTEEEQEHRSRIKDRRGLLCSRLHPRSRRDPFL